MELAPGVHGLSLDVSLENQDLTLHPTAVETPRGLLLLDVGLPEKVDVLADALDAEGFALADTWAVAVTHQDLDHVGCLAEVVDRTDAVVFAHERAVPYLEGDTELVKSTAERPMELEPVTVDVHLTGGETFATAAGPMRAIHTPGHSPGHTSFFFPDSELLVSADALNVVDDELVGPREAVTQDPETAWESVETLSGFDVAETFCFHGGYIDAGADRLRALLTERQQSE